MQRVRGQGRLGARGGARLSINLTELHRNELHEAFRQRDIAETRLRQAPTFEDELTAAIELDAAEKNLRAAYRRAKGKPA